MLLFQRCLATITIKIYWTYRIITGSLDDDYTISSTQKKKSFNNTQKIKFHTIAKQTLQAKLPENSLLQICHQKNPRQEMP